MKNKATPLVDEYLKSMDDMQLATTGEFFYSRLKAKMEKDIAPANWAFTLKPVWVIGMLTVLLTVNALLFINRPASQTDKPAEPLSLQAFAESYGLTATPTY